MALSLEKMFCRSFSQSKIGKKKEEPQEKETRKKQKDQERDFFPPVSCSSDICAVISQQHLS